MTHDQPGDAPGAMHDEPLARPLPPIHRRRGAGPIVATVLLAFVLGMALAGWLAWRGTLDPLLVRPSADSAAPPASAHSAMAPPQPAAAAITAVEARVALLEDRLSRIGDDASAASANATRAEGLLIASASRRVIERGGRLGFLEDQLKLRFGDAQPNAVRTIIAASRQPVTLLGLSSQLEEATPMLAGTRAPESTWTRIQREIASLFVIRRTASPATTPLERAERAQVLLMSGEIEKAISEIERLPGAADAQGWIDAARRYDATQRALDQIETAALLEPRRKPGGQGRPGEPAGLAEPAGPAEQAGPSAAAAVP